MSLQGMKGMLAGAVVTLCAAAALHAQENYTQWTGLRTYYLNTATSGANVVGTVLNFPVLIRLGAADSAIFTAAKAGGADLRFTKSNGVRLKHQIELWNAAGRTAAIWVRVDTVKGNTANQALRMHWGKADAADSSRGAAVFDTALGFVGVWHMDGTAGVVDATANALSAVPGAGVPGAGTGSIGSGRTFDGSTQYFSVADNPRLNFTEQLTLSLWVNATNWAGSTRLLQKSAAGDNNAGQWGLRDDSNNMLALNLNGIHTANGTTASPPTGEWHLVHATFDGSATALYLDGGMVASGSNTAPIATSSGDLQIARRPDATSYFTGTLDEVRVNRVARNADWVKLEYENQKAAQSLLTTTVVSIRAGAANPAAGFTVKASGRGLEFGFEGARTGRATLALLDMHGRTLWSGSLANGVTRIEWNGRASGGAVVPAGIYAARLTVLDAQGRLVQVLDRKVPYTP